jgi:hypothetical protein
MTRHERTKRFTFRRCSCGKICRGDAYKDHLRRVKGCEGEQHSMGQKRLCCVACCRAWMEVEPWKDFTEAHDKCPSLQLTAKSFQDFYNRTFPAAAAVPEIAPTQVPTQAPAQSLPLPGPSHQVDLDKSPEMIIEWCEEEEEVERLSDVSGEGIVASTPRPDVAEAVAAAIEADTRERSAAAATPASATSTHGVLAVNRK